MNDLTKKRWEEFNAEHADYESGAFGELVFSIQYQLLEPLFGPDPAYDAMEALFHASGVKGEGVGGLWYGTMEDLPFEEVNKFKFYRDLVALAAYAYYGLPVEDPDIKHIPETVEKRASCIEALIDCYDSLHLTLFSGGTQFESTLKAAKARWAMDSGDADASVRPDELAALAEVSLKSIKNLLTPSSSSGLHALEDGAVPVSEARRWLNSRSGFRQSVWQIVGYAASLETPPAPKPESLQDIVFVPVAKDGTWFSPEHNQSGKYRIGPKANEQAMADYMEALGVLNCMDPPMWRRPSAKGHWGIVAGVAWERKTRTELGL